MTQTAVEWLVEQMKLDELFNADYFIEQAKEMEKEQLCYFYIKGVEGEMSNPYITNIEFYNKTFKSKQ